MNMRCCLLPVVGILALLIGGCGMLDPVEPRTTTSDDDNWGAAWRSADTETQPLGLSSRAREIERNVGVGR